MVISTENLSKIKTFINEFYHEDHGSNDIRICLIIDEQPTVELKEWIIQQKKVYLLVGDSLVIVNLDKLEK